MVLCCRKTLRVEVPFVQLTSATNTSFYTGGPLLHEEVAKPPGCHQRAGRVDRDSVTPLLVAWPPVRSP
jgi:hypothetical protein